MKNIELSFVIPVYNEEKNISKAVDLVTNFIKKNNLGSEIIVVNDNSSDNGPEILGKLAKKNRFLNVIHRNKRNRGMGYALREGTKHAKGKYVIWTMADLSDDLKTCLKFLDKLRLNYDLVIGSRNLIVGSRSSQGKLKAIASRFYSGVTCLLFGIRSCTDITNAFRGFKMSMYEKIRLSRGDFSISPEMAIIAHKKGYKIGEVATNYKERSEGKSSFKILKMILSYGSLFFK